MEMVINLSIIVPCYNEEKNLPHLLKRFSAVMLPKMELIIVNNGSTDNSKKVIKQLLKRHRFARCTEVKKNVGYGFGIVSGLKAAKGDFIAWTHADMQTDPGDVIRAFKIIEKEKNPERHFIKGRREGRPIVDVLFTCSMSLFCSLILGTWMTDINAQPNLFHRSFLKKMQNPPDDFSLDLYAFYIAKNNSLEIERLPVVFGKRLHGISHWNFSFKSKMKFIKRTFDFTLKLRKRLQNDTNSA